MADEESYDFVHAFISSSRNAVCWGFWHIARAIYQRSQEPGMQEIEFAVSFKSSVRDNALLLMCRGTKNG